MDILVNREFPQVLGDMHKTNTLQRSLSLVSLSETNYYNVMWNPLKARYNESATRSVLVVYILLCLLYLESCMAQPGLTWPMGASYTFLFDCKSFVRAVAAVSHAQRENRAKAGDK